MDEKQTLAEVSKETLTLEAYLSSLKPGESRTYVDIEVATGVRMDVVGRNRLRTAKKRANREYTVIRAVGIEMSSPTNGRAIVVERCVRVDNAVKRADKTAGIICAQHGAEMEPNERRQVEMIAATFGAIRVIAEQRKRELRQMNSGRPRCVPQRSIA